MSDQPPLPDESQPASGELGSSKEELQSVNEVLTTVNDELKTRVDEVTKANDDLRNLIAASDIATVFVDADLRIESFTPRAASIFDIIGSDAGRPLLDITHRLDYPGLADDAREAFSSRRTVEREVRSDDGRWYLARMLPYRTQEDRIEGAVLNFIDVSARRLAEERLRAGEARLKLLAETTEDFAIITLDADGLITSWNKGAERVFGYLEREAIGQHAGLIFTAADRENGVPAAEMRNAREHGKALDERWHRHKDGSLVYCSGVMTTLHAEGSEGYAKIARDLTAAKRAQEQREVLLRSEKSLRMQLEAANRQKDEFLAVMSHELKNPLNLIAMNAELLQRLPETQRIAGVARIAGTIRASVASQARIIDDLLDLSRMQTGKLSLNRQRVEWDQVVRRICDAVRSDVAAKGLTLEQDIAADDYSIDADPVRLEQIVWNLVSNALKFTPAGGRIEISLAARQAELVLVVADSGRGIETSFIGRLFDMFSQAETGVARREGGLGIGLALTKRLIDLHDGRLEVESAGANQGARFTVRLPRAGRRADPLLPRPASAAALAGLTLLLVDDQQDTLDTFASLLRLEGADVVAARGAEQALDAIERQKVDLVVSDVAMPGIDGYSLLAELRRRGWQGPAIAVSGIGPSVHRRRALEAGFEEIIGKPIDMGKLLEAIALIIGRRADGR